MENKNKATNQIVETSIKDFNKQVNSIKKLQQQTNKSISEIVETPIKDFNKQVNSIKKLQQQTNKSIKSKTSKF